MNPDFKVEVTRMRHPLNPPEGGGQSRDITEFTDQLHSLLQSASDGAFVGSPPGEVGSSDSSFERSKGDVDEVPKKKYIPVPKGGLPKRIPVAAKGGPKLKVKEPEEKPDLDFILTKDSRAIYSVLYGKLSMKKHKNWEGDGTIHVNGTSVTLKNEDGATIYSDPNFKYCYKIIEANEFQFGGHVIQVQELLEHGTLEVGKPPASKSNQRGHHPPPKRPLIPEPESEEENYAPISKPAPTKSISTMLEKFRRVKPSSTVTLASVAASPSRIPTQRQMIPTPQRLSKIPTPKKPTALRLAIVTPRIVRQEIEVMDEDDEEGGGGEDVEEEEEEEEEQVFVPPPPKKTLKSKKSYTVMYSRKNTRKNKIWESDGILHVVGTKVTLKDLSDNTVESASDFKGTDLNKLTEGSIFFIGGKEVQIQELVEL